MEELTQDQIIEALNSNPELVSGIATHIIDTDHGKNLVQTRATALYQQNIGDEVKNIYGRFDQDAFETLGEKPAELEGGKKEKTYDFTKRLFSELKDLREKKDQLNADAEVQRLKGEVEKLKTEGGGAHWQKTLETERQKWLQEKEELTKKNEQLEQGVYSSSVKGDIAKAKSELKFNPDIPKSAIDAMFSTIEAELVKNSKKEGEKIVYLDADGSIILDDQGFKSAKGILEERLADVLLKDDGGSGGSAQETIVGSIKIKKVEGKDDVKSLSLKPGSFKTQVEFHKVATEALIAEGIPKSSDEHIKLLDKAKIEYNVKTLPRS